MENSERSCRAQCKGYHPEICKYSWPTLECYNEGASEYISRAQGASKPQVRPRYHVQLPNQLITPPRTQYLTTHQTTIPLYPNLPPLHAIPFTTSSSLTPTQSLHPPLTSALAPQTHYPSFPRIVIPPQYPGWVPVNNTKGHNCE